MAEHATSVAVIGTGIVGISTAYYLVKNHNIRDVTLIDCGQPMAFTSAQSGENYRNWWPHPTMVAFTNRSIDLMEQIALDSGNRINMTRRGYTLATRRRDISDLVAELNFGLGDAAARLIRFHDGPAARSYRPAEKPDWQQAPNGVDVLQNADLIRRTFPSFAQDIAAVIHIRRAGDLSGQQLGAYMLEHIREAGGHRETGMVQDIEHSGRFRIVLEQDGVVRALEADAVVNAAGPFAPDIARMLGRALPIETVMQQKIAFEDARAAIPRDLPFSIDLDPQHIDWSQEEKSALEEDDGFAWAGEEMPGAIHCRPDGGDNGRWIKLGWAFNTDVAPATWQPPLSDSFPEIALRGAARLNPALRGYYNHLPRAMHHYGGWYAMTEENWPLIGSCGPEGAFVNGAHSGFGTMTACASGELCAALVSGAAAPEYAGALSTQRHADSTFMAAVLASGRGVL